MRSWPKRLNWKQLALLAVPVALGVGLAQLQAARRRAYVPLQNVRMPKLYRFGQRAAALAFSPGGHKLAVADGQQQLWFYDLDSHQFEWHFDHQCGDAAQSLIWHKPDGLVIADHERTRLFAVPQGTLQREIPPLPSWRSKQYRFRHHYQLVLSPMGNVAARGQVHGILDAWNAVTGHYYLAPQAPHRVPQAPHRATCGLALSADGTTLAVGSIMVRHAPDDTRWEMATPVGIEVALREAHTGQLKQTFRWDDAEVGFNTGSEGSLGGMGLAFSPDGKTLAGVATGGLVLWDVTSGRLLHQFRETSKPRWGGKKWVAFAPTGTFVAASGWGDVIYTWSVKTGELLQIFHGPRFSASLAFSPDGKLLATGGQDKAGEGVVKIWDVQDLAPQ